MIQQAHKKFLVFLIVSCLVSFFIFPNNSSTQDSVPGLHFDLGFSSGFPVYGDSQVQVINDEINNAGHRVIAGITGDILLDLSENFTLFTGADLFFDFNWNDNGEHFNHTDLAVFPGLKIYPNLLGFNSSVAYSICCRFDSYSGTEVFDSVLWGNGFRVGVEYDFSRGANISYLPSMGIYYRFCPRGNYRYDNIFAVYLLLNL